MRKTTTVATALGMALVVFVFSSVLMLVDGLERTMARAGSSDVAVVLRRGADAEVNSHISDRDASIVRSARHIAVSESGMPDAIEEILLVVALEKIGTTGIGNVAIRGVEVAGAGFRRGVQIGEGRAARPGTDEAIVGASIRGRFAGLELGDSFELAKGRQATVVGIFSDGGSSYESEVWMDLEVARGAFGRESTLSSVRARLTSPEAYAEFERDIEGHRRLELQVYRETDFLAEQSHGTMQFLRAMGLMIAFFFAVGAMIGAMITMHSSVAHRHREIGVLRALGFAQSQILLSFLLESLLLSSFAGGLGALASSAMGLVRFSTTNFVNWSEIVFAFEPTAGTVLVSLAFACLMGVLGGFVPALRAARVSPLSAMRG